MANLSLNLFQITFWMLYQTPTTAGTGDKNIIILKYMMAFFEREQKTNLFQ